MNTFNQLDIFSMIENKAEEIKINQRPMSDEKMTKLQTLIADAKYIKEKLYWEALELEEKIYKCYMDKTPNELNIGTFENYDYKKREKALRCWEKALERNRRRCAKWKSEKI